MSIGHNRGADALPESYAVEFESRSALPSWLVKAVMRAENAAMDARVPVVIVHEIGIRCEDDLVVMKLKHFETMAANQMPRLRLDMPKVDLSKFDDLKIDLSKYPDLKLSDFDFRLSDSGPPKKDQTP